METKVSHARFFALIKQLPGTDKEDLVWQYSHMLTNSLSEFYEKRPEDYHRMISDLQQTVNEMGRAMPQKEDIAELKYWRSAILHRLQKYGIDTTDWSKVNGFMSQSRIAGKTLGKMTIDEMKTLVPKLESILKKEKNRRIKIEQLARLN